jgi:hypothetical protein
MTDDHWPTVEGSWAAENETPRKRRRRNESGAVRRTLLRRARREYKSQALENGENLQLVTTYYKTFLHTKKI